MRSKKIGRQIGFAVDVINLKTPIPPHELLNHLDYSRKVIDINIILFYMQHKIIQIIFLNYTSHGSIQKIKIN